MRKKQLTKEEERAKRQRSIKRLIKSGKNVSKHSLVSIEEQSEIDSAR